MDASTLIPQYAAAGMTVGPLHWNNNGRCSCSKANCDSPAKHPLTINGKDDFTTDLGQIAEWLARYPYANWGARPPVGIIVVDVDPRNDGDVRLAEFTAKHGALPETLTQRTGSGGLHHLFAYNGPTRGRLCLGLDVKSNSGYIVVAPSVHICGGRYEWLNWKPAAYAPQWVKDILNPPRVIRHRADDGGSIDRWVDLYNERAVEGERNRLLFWCACRAYEYQLDPEPLIEAAVDSGLDEREARRTVESAARAPARAPMQEPEPTRPATLDDFYSQPSYARVGA